MDYDLDRFISAQRDVYSEVLSELASGRKTTHWMWFIFPQIRGLGHSETSRRYAIGSLDEARAYLDHPTLGARLRECTALVLNVSNRSLTEIFGEVDAMKFCSCMTLFEQATTDNALFRSALDRFCDGRADDATLALLGAPHSHDNGTKPA